MVLRMSNYGGGKGARVRGADLWGRCVFRNFVLNGGGLIALANGTRAFVSMKNYERNARLIPWPPSLSCIAVNEEDYRFHRKRRADFETVDGLVSRRETLRNNDSYLFFLTLKNLYHIFSFSLERHAGENGSSTEGWIGIFIWLKCSV